MVLSGMVGVPPGRSRFWSYARVGGTLVREIDSQSSWKRRVHQIRVPPTLLAVTSPPPPDILPRLHAAGVFSAYTGPK